MQNMVHSQPQQIKSGWKIIFMIFQLAATDPEESIMELAFITTAKIINEIFVTNFAGVIDSFQEAVKCLSEFACNPHNPDMSMEAIGLIRRCAQLVAEHPTLFAEHPWEDNFSIPAAERIWMRGWFPIMFAMSSIVSRCKLDVRTRGTVGKFHFLNLHLNLKNVQV